MGDETVSHLKETIESKEFKIAFLLGIVSVFILVELPYFQVPAHPEALARLQIQLCHNNLHQLDLALSMLPAEDPDSTSLVPPVTEPKVIKKLFTKFLKLKHIYELPRHPETKDDLSQCYIIVPPSCGEETPRWFCFQHGFGKPLPTGIDEKASAREQLQQYGIEASSLLEKCPSNEKAF